MLFQLVLTKFFKSELFSCLPKVDHVIKSCEEPISFYGQWLLSRSLRSRYLEVVGARENERARERRKGEKERLPEGPIKIVSESAEISF